MEELKLTFDEQSLLDDLDCLDYCVHEYFCGLPDEDVAYATEKLVRVHAFVKVMSREFPAIVAGASDEMGKCALEEMREWIDASLSVDN